MLKHQIVSLTAALWLGLTGLSHAQNTSSGLDFGPITFAGYDNYVYRDDVTAAQVVVTKCVFPSERLLFLSHITLITAQARP